ncbi:hypothetical protein ES703_106826 [subsurface metagenome]
MPDKLIRDARRVIEFILLKTVGYLFGNLPYPGHNPTISQGKITLFYRGEFTVIQVHKHKSGSIPDLINKIPVSRYPFF